VADQPRPARPTRSGPGIVLVSVYGLLALAATGRSVLQISEYFSRAPLAYLLSALAAVIYIVATVALARGGRTSRAVARITFRWSSSNPRRAIRRCWMGCVAPAGSI